MTPNLGRHVTKPWCYSQHQLQGTGHNPAIAECVFLRHSNYERPKLCHIQELVETGFLESRGCKEDVGTNYLDSGLPL